MKYELTKKNEEIRIKCRYNSLIKYFFQEWGEHMEWCFHEKNISFIFHYCNFHFGDQNPEMETKWRSIFAKSLT